MSSLLWRSGVHLLVAAPGLLALSVQTWLLGAQVRDDAYISFRYGARLATGRGLTFNDGEVVEGYSNFLWVLFSAFVESLGFRSDEWLPVLGFLCAAALVVLTAVEALRLARLGGAGERVCLGLAAFGALAIGSHSSLAYYGVTGLETSAFALALTWAGIALLRAQTLTFSSCALLALLLRPEGALVAVVGLVSVLALSLRQRERSPGLGALLPLILGALIYCGFKLAYFGQLLPNTAVAKPAVLAHGVSYVTGALSSELALLLLVSLGALGLWAGRTKRGASGVALGVLLGLWGLYALGISLTGGDWMPGLRRMVPQEPWLVLAAVLAVSLFVVRSAWWKLPLVLLGLGAHLVVTLVSTDEVRGSARNIESYSPARRGLYRSLGEQQVQRLATSDIGMPGYFLPGVRIVDLVGLTDLDIARLPGAHMHKALTPQLLESRKPDVVLLSGPGRAFGRSRLMVPIGPPSERALFSLPAFQKGYRFERSLRLGTGYYVHLFRRADSSQGARR